MVLVHTGFRLAMTAEAIYSPLFFNMYRNISELARFFLYKSPLIVPVPLHTLSVDSSVL